MSKGKDSPTLPLEDVIRMMPGNVYWKNLEGQFLGCNNRQARNLGLSSSAEVVGKTDYDFLSTKEADYIRQNDLRVIESKSCLIVDEPMRKEDGTVIYYLSEKSPLFNNQGQVIGIVGITMDITPEREAKNQLSKQKLMSETTLEKIISILPGHVYWKDENGIFLGCNKSQANSLGVSSPQELVGKSDYDIFPKEQADKITELDNKVIRSAKPHIAEEISDTASGETAFYLSHKVPLTNSNAEIIGILGLSLDITDKKKAEEKLLKANLGKAQLISSIGHLIRGPLTAILGTAQVLQQTNQSSKQAQATKIIEDSAKKISPILERIQFYIDLENGAEKSIEADVEIKKFFEDVWKQHMPAMKAKSIDAIFEYDDQLPSWVHIGSYFLYLVLDNLISNAVRYTSKGKVTLSVNQLPQQDNKTIIEITVGDTGIGIRPETQEKLFNLLEPKQLDEDLSFAETGLKLSITAKMVEMLGGTLKVVSNINQGAVFSFSMPVQAVNPRVYSYTNDYAYFYPTSQSKKLQRPLDDLIHVLVVEDDILAQRVLKMMLETEYNCRIDQVYTIADGVQQCQANQYDIVFTDMSLPDGSGLDFFKIVKDNMDNIPVIAVTAYASDAEKEEIIESGIVDIIVKPVDLSVLKLVVHSYVFEEQVPYEE